MCENQIRSVKGHFITIPRILQKGRGKADGPDLLACQACMTLGYLHGKEQGRNQGTRPKLILTGITTRHIIFPHDKLDPDLRGPIHMSFHTIPPSPGIARYWIVLASNDQDQHSFLGI